VVEYGEQSAWLTIGVDVEGRADKAPAADAEPAADNLEAIWGRPPHALDLESDLGGRGLGVISDRRHAY
jgi:hypothetical protein